MSKKLKLFTAVLLCFTLVACLICLVACDDNDVNETQQTDQLPIVSAYNTAREYGYTGTLEDFIEAISGRDGVDGTDGRDGIDGTNGKDGVGIRSVVLSEDGKLIVYATDGTVLFKQKLPLCNHVYSNSVVESRPTCVSNGYSSKQCKKCGDKQYEALPAIGHDWDDGETAFEPTCVQNGLRIYTCSVCKQTKTEILYATGMHEFKDEVCRYCNISRAEFIDRRYNGSYGYEYLSDMDNGNHLCAFYDEINDTVLSFHNDARADAQLLDGSYELTSLDYDRFGLTVDEAVSVFKTFLDDKPLYYWISKSVKVSGTRFIIGVEEDYAQGTVRHEYNEKLYNTIESFTSVAQDESAYSVALALHDKIILSIDYAYKGNVPEDASWAHNIVGVFEGKGAVCEGYARAFQLLLNARGVKNVFVTGESRNQNHAWNLVQLDDDNWYWYDLTWDDTPNYGWGILHRYTCVTDEEFLKTHTPHSHTGTGIDFLYELPSRATASYKGASILNCEFSLDGAKYVIVGYDIVNISCITACGDYVIPQTVTYNDREFTVVSLTDLKNGEIFDVTVGDIFPYDSELTSVNIPSTVVYIGDFALRSNALQSITVDENNPNFRDVDGVLFTKDLRTLISYPAGSTRREFVIPDETYYIAHGAFEVKVYNSLLNLESLKIGKNLCLAGVLNWGYGYPSFNIIGGEWGDGIMSNLSPTAKVTVSEDSAFFKVKDGLILNINETVLYAGLPDVKTVVIPETVNTILTSAFRNNKSLTSVTFTSPIQDLEWYIFIGCVNLEQVTLVEGMEIITDMMFHSCKSLKTIEIPSSVKVIERCAFRWCDSLEQVIISDGVTTLGESAFEACKSLKTLVIPKSVICIGEDVLGPVSPNYDCYIDKTNLNIFFEGTATEWAEIDIDETFLEYGVEVCFYSEEKPQTKGSFWHYVDGEIVVW